jgi:hypothetical protein
MMDFDGAQATCQVDGANLASISSAFEQMSIEIATKNIVGPIWIGLKHQVCGAYYTETSNAIARHFKYVLLIFS